MNVSGRVLVIGYGNPLRGDDGIGWEAAKQLAREVRENDVWIIWRHQLTPELAETISRVQTVIFIDASADRAPGELTMTQLTSAQPSSIGWHHSGPGELLALAHTLYGTAPEATVISIGGASFGYEQQLSEPVRTALPDLLNRVRQLIARNAPSSTTEVHHA